MLAMGRKTVELVDCHEESCSFTAKQLLLGLCEQKKKAEFYFIE